MELGKLPIGWESQPLSEVTSYLGRGRSTQQGASNVCLLKTRHVYPDGLRAFDDCRLSEDEAEKVQPERLLQPGDVLICSSAAGCLGRPAFFEGYPHPCTTDTHVAIARSDSAKLDPRFLFYYVQSPQGQYELLSREQGGKWQEEKVGFRLTELNLADLRTVPVPFPSLDEQHRIVTRLDEFAERVAEINQRRSQMDEYARQFLLGAYASISKDAPLMPMGEVAPLVRRAVKVKSDEAYHELGLRSFGKGTFHKPAITGSALGSKRIFHIEPGDLLFSNVFAWEGAIAVAKAEDKGRVGSHRYITCVAKEDVAKASYLCFHFLTERGLQQIGEASPGSAGRNRTLGLKALENIQVPVPPFEKQMWFDALVTKLYAIRAAQLETQRELDALMPAVLDRAFRGEL